MNLQSTDIEGYNNPLARFTVEPIINGERWKKLTIETEDVAFTAKDDFVYEDLIDVIRQELNLSKSDKIELWDYDFKVLNWQGVKFDNDSYEYYLDHAQERD